MSSYGERQQSERKRERGLNLPMNPLHDNDINPFWRTEPSQPNHHSKGLLSLYHYNGNKILP